MTGLHTRLLAIHSVWHILFSVIGRVALARCYSAAAVSAAPTPSAAAPAETYEDAVAAYNKARDNYGMKTPGSPEQASALEECLALWQKKEALTPAVDHHGNWERANKIYFGPERDMKNFPHPERAEFHPPVRHRLVPEEWFTALYKRTGVSGTVLCHEFVSEMRVGMK